MRKCSSFRVGSRYKKSLRSKGFFFVLMLLIFHTESIHRNIASFTLSTVIRNRISLIVIMWSTTFRCIRVVIIICIYVIIVLVVWGIIVRNSFTTSPIIRPLVSCSTSTWSIIVFDCIWSIHFETTSSFYTRDISLRICPHLVSDRTSTCSIIIGRSKWSIDTTSNGSYTWAFSIRIRCHTRSIDTDTVSIRVFFWIWSVDILTGSSWYTRTIPSSIRSEFISFETSTVSICIRCCILSIHIDTRLERGSVRIIIIPIVSIVAIIGIVVAILIRAVVFPIGSSDTLTVRPTSVTTIVIRLRICTRRRNGYETRNERKKNHKKWEKCHSFHIRKR